ncbi:MAG TPA: hypothetical protein ENI27_06720 [bacterium]|nr:hypothetical protein [bacterium]
MTQLSSIRADLEAGKSITPLDALNRYGCFRLGARIWELRKQGMDIKMTNAHVKKGVCVARYSL